MQYGWNKGKSTESTSDVCHPEGRRFYFSPYKRQGSYLVRRTKAHAKSARWLDCRLSMFFVNKNLEG